MNGNKITEVQIDWNEWYFEDAVFKDLVSLRSTTMTIGVRFELWDGEPLPEIADDMRIKRGLLPLWDFEETGRECDEDSWYEFYIGINDWNEHHIDNAITVICQHGVDMVDYDDLLIPLSGEEQQLIYNSIDRQCRDILGKGCEELLADARKEIEGWS